MNGLLRRTLLALTTLVLALPLAAFAPAGAAAGPAADGPNLLQNPGFEPPYAKQCCQPNRPDALIDEVQVAAGWRGWWLEPDQDPAHKSDCPNQSCVPWHRPEFRNANCGDVCADRVHSGGDAQKYFTFYSVHEAGMYQQVGGVAPGQRVRFSVYMEAWSTHATYGPSSGQTNMGMRVGIDPFGGTNPYSPNVIWGGIFDSYDVWSLYSVEAVAQAGVVTVFTRSAPEQPFQHNDIYVDDASLVVVGASSSTGGRGQPPAPAPTVAPTAVPGFIYVVQPGDNYYRLARRFGVTVSSILLANHITNPNLLLVGARIIIPGVSGPLPPTDSPPPPAGPPSPTPTLDPATVPGAFAYVVQRGDNLYRLARRFGTTVARIKQLNGLVGDIIYIGQTLIIAP